MNEATRESERVDIMLHPWKAMRHPGSPIGGCLTIWAGVSLLLWRYTTSAEPFNDATLAAVFMLGVGAILVLSSLVAWGLAMAECDY